MRTLSFLVVLMATSALGTGCLRSSTAVYEGRRQGDGTARPYAVSPEHARAIALEVLRENGAESVEEYPDHVVGTWSVTAAGWGSFMGVWLEPADTGTSVTAIQRRKGSVQIATDLTETGFQAEFNKKVAQRGARASL